MEVFELRNKLIEQFNLYIQDDSKLEVLEGVFDALNTEDGTSLISEKHYKVIEERRRKHHVGETTSLTWETVKENLHKKYGF